METHLVFYTDQHGSFKDAVKRPFGLTVLAILFSVKLLFTDLDQANIQGVPRGKGQHFTTCS